MLAGTTATFFTLALSTMQALYARTFVTLPMTMPSVAALCFDAICQTFRAL